MVGQVEVGAINMICEERASHASCLASRGEHEVIDDELAASVEKLGEGLAAVRSVESVLLVDLHPRHRAALGVQLIELMCDLLLFGEEFLTRCDPLFL